MKQKFISKRWMHRSSFLLILCWLNGIMYAQNNIAKPAPNSTLPAKSLTTTGKDDDADEKKNPEIASAWRTMAGNPNLTYSRTIKFCDSLFAIPGNIDGDKDGEYVKYLRWKFFWASRSDANTGKLHDYNSVAAMKRSKTAAKTSGTIGETDATDCQGTSTLQSSVQELAGGGPDGYGWGFIGPQNIPLDQGQHLGQINQMIINPSNSNEMYASDFVGGLWKTSDGGNTWICLTDNDKTISGIGVGHFDVDFSSSPRRLYVSLGYPGFFYNPPKWDQLWSNNRTFGLFFSDDDGADWHSIDGVSSNWINAATWEGDLMYPSGGKSLAFRRRL